MRYSKKIMKAQIHLGTLKKKIFTQRSFSLHYSHYII